MALEGPVVDRDREYDLTSLRLEVDPAMMIAKPVTHDGNVFRMPRRSCPNARKKPNTRRPGPVALC